MLAYSVEDMEQPHQARDTFPRVTHLLQDHQLHIRQGQALICALRGQFLYHHILHPD